MSRDTKPEVLKMDKPNITLNVVRRAGTWIAITSHGMIERGSLRELMDEVVSYVEARDSLDETLAAPPRPHRSVGLDKTPALTVVPTGGDDNG